MLLAADVHLAADAPARNARFFSFLAGAARRGRALFLLGDLFDVWAGDDDAAPPAQEAKDALAALIAAGVPVFVQRGNRDFLLGARFMHESGCSLLPDDYVLEADGMRWLLTHGDMYADDPPYRRYRRWRPVLSAAAAVLSLNMRRRLAQKMRAASTATAAAMPTMDDAMCAAALRRLRCSAMVHGHLHQAGEFACGDGRRFCLPDWETAPGYGAIADGQLRFVDA